MQVNWHAEVSAQLTWYWDHVFRPSLEGLTDEEYLWEPVGNCWTVRPAGNGAFRCDWSWPTPTPPPFTTIAWRLCHLGANVMGIRANQHFGDGALTIEGIRWPGRAKDAVDFVEQAYRDWTSGVAALDEAGLARRSGYYEGPFSDQPLATLVLHVNREVVHHAAGIAQLRELYRDRRTIIPPPRPH
ncbi:DinB family protein [Kutzneria viridogrisea]|uniref:DinB-like domain-containing protein n=2 Tax=Kutzneria TaxID=43356 RepID=W5WM18_9PSEU|nr:DinB family protein [Kutzneria albida]AHI01826.1 hypothetical protein KALB_8469 [Kutzneria albida DSM 43870]MBA8929756.1 hypothetical protein [Kutzneria viridogrisea]